MRILIFILSLLLLLNAETLFEVKDASNNPVLNVSTDGLRILNEGDTLMVISSEEIKANIGTSSKGLSRSFSVTTTQSKGSGDLMRLTSDSTRFWISDTGSGFGVASQTAAGKSVATNFLQVSNINTQMREGESGGRYTHFSPYNIFIGLNTGLLTYPHEGPFGAEFGEDNIFIGNNTGTSNVDGFGNIFIGANCGVSNDQGYSNMFIGNESGASNMDGYSNMFIGNYSGNSNTGGDRNTFVGFHSGMSNVSGGGNTVLGYSALSGLDSGNHNTAVGQEAGQYNNTGSYNSYFGSGAGEMNDGGNSNSIFGYEAGRGSIGNSFSNNCFYGYQAGYSNITGSGNVFLGYQAGYNETASNKLYIDNSSTTTPLIWGDFAVNTLRFNGNVGVGIAPSTTYGVSVDESIVGGHFQGRSTGTYSRGVRGYASGGTSTNYGVYGYATGTGATNYAGYFSGDINVTGTVVKSSDEVKIDHPLDPENKTLSHSTVSSDRMTNLYHGNAVLNSNGSAEVILPDWFESVNTDYRYQLTAIGSAAPNLHISREISSGKFEIAGGKPGMKVSWQITTVRNDQYAKKNRIKTEKNKRQEEKGYYLHPAAYDLPEEMGIEYQIENKMKDSESE